MKRKKINKKKQEKLVVGLSHSGAVAIPAPVHYPMVLAYSGIAGGTFCEVLVCG